MGADSNLESRIKTNSLVARKEGNVIYPAAFFNSKGIPNRPLNTDEIAKVVRMDFAHGTPLIKQDFEKWKELAINVSVYCATVAGVASLAYITCRGIVEIAKYF